MVDFTATTAIIITTTTATITMITTAVLLAHCLNSFHKLLLPRYNDDLTAFIANLIYLLLRGIHHVSEDQR